MGDDSKASCLTATSSIVVAIVGASATIIAALIAIWYRPMPPTPTDVVRPTPTAHSTPIPGPTGNQLNDGDEPPRRTPMPKSAPRLEGLYVLQAQNVSAPMQAQMELTKVADDTFSWRTDYTYFAFPANPLWATGELTNADGQWLLSMQDTNEPNSMPYEIPVRIILNNNVLVIAVNDNQGMTWRKR